MRATRRGSAVDRSRRIEVGERQPIGGPGTGVRPVWTAHRLSCRADARRTREVPEPPLSPDRLIQAVRRGTEETDRCADHDVRRERTGQRDLNALRGFGGRGGEPHRRHGTGSDARIAGKRHAPPAVVRRALLRPLIEDEDGIARLRLGEERRQRVLRGHRTRRQCDDGARRINAADNRPTKLRAERERRIAHRVDIDVVRRTAARSGGDATELARQNVDRLSRAPLGLDDLARAGIEPLLSHEDGHEAAHDQSEQDEHHHHLRQRDASTHPDGALWRAVQCDQMHTIWLR